jgi:hypothetical protein
MHDFYSPGTYVPTYFVEPGESVLPYLCGGAGGVMSAVNLL